MVPVSITLDGFLSYKESQTLDFEGAALWMLSGKNGAGKSSVFDAMYFALYGAQARGANLSDLIHRRCDRARVSFTFDAGGKRYRIERVLTKKPNGDAGSKTALYEGDSKTPLPESTSVSTCNPLVERLVGMSAKVFEWSVMLRQNQAEKLIDKLVVNQAGNSDAAQLLKEMVDLSAYVRLHEKAVARRRDAESEARARELRLSELPEISDDTLAAAASEIVAASAILAASQEECEKLESRIEPALRYAHVLEQIQTLEADLARSRALLGDAEAIRKNASRAKQIDAFLPGLRDRDDARKRLRATNETIARTNARRAALPEPDELDARIQASRDADRALSPLRQFHQAAKTLETLAVQLSDNDAQSSALPALAELDTRLSQAESAREILPAFERRDTIDSELARLNDEIGPLQAELEGSRQPLANLEATLEQVREQTEVAGASHRDALVRASVAQSDWKRALAHKTRVESLEETATCTLCGQEISAEYRERQQQDAIREEQATRDALESCEEAARTLDADLGRWKVQRANTEGSLREAKRLVAQLEAWEETNSRDRMRLKAERGALDERIAGGPFSLAETSESVRTLAKTLPELKKQCASLNALKHASERLALQIAQATATREDAARTLNDLGIDPRTADADAFASEAGQLAERKRVRETRRELDAEFQMRSAVLVEQEQTLSREEKALAGTAAADAETSVWETERESLADSIEREAELERAERSSRTLQDERATRIDERDKTPDEDRAPVDNIRTTLGQARETRRAAEKLRSERETALRTLVTRRDDRAAAFSAWDSSRKRADSWRELEKQLGPQRLQAWLLAEAEEIVVEGANRHLDAFSRGSLRLEKRPESLLLLDLVCRNEMVDDEILGLGNLSGSQKFRVAVSLALALGEYASQTAGRIQAVIIDEGFGGLDADSQREMGDELRGLSDRLERLIVVSHQEAFADAFENRYLIRMENGGSVPERG